MSTFQKLAATAALGLALAGCSRAEFASRGGSITAKSTDYNILDPVTGQIYQTGEDDSSGDLTQPRNCACRRVIAADGQPSNLSILLDVDGNGTGNTGSNNGTNNRGNGNGNGNSGNGNGNYNTGNGNGNFNCGNDNGNYNTGQLNGNYNFGDNNGNNNGGSNNGNYNSSNDNGNGFSTDGNGNAATDTASTDCCPCPS
jgi:hypothetical protein